MTNSCAGQRQWLVGSIFKTDAGVHQIIGTQRELLRQHQPVGKIFFRADTIGGPGQSEITVADEAGVAQHCQHRHCGMRVQSRHAVAWIFILPAPPGGNRLGIIQQLHQFQAAAARSERVTRRAVGQHHGMFRQTGVEGRCRRGSRSRGHGGGRIIGLGIGGRGLALAAMATLIGRIK